MRLLQLNVTANWGSTGKIAEGIGQAAMSGGWESAIAYGRMMNPSGSRLIKVGNKACVYAHYALNRLYDGEGLGSGHATRRLLKQIDGYSPDIIHLHNIHDHWINYPRLFEHLRESRVHVVWTFHDCWPFTGGCCHFVQSGCEAWKTGCVTCKSKRTYCDHTSRNFNLKTKLISSLGSRLTIVPVSGWLDSLVADSRLGHLNRKVIYNGIDTDVFSPRDVAEVDSRYSLSGKKMFLGVSNVWPESKGLKDYIALSARLPEDYKIVLVGLTRKQANTLPTGIIGIPRTDSVNELAALYSRADAVLSLSKAETFGLTLAEGLACGTPSIGYAATAVKEMLSPDTGIPVPPGDVRKLREAVMSVGSGTKSFQADVCRDRAIRHFDSHRQYGKYIQLYEELLSGNRRSS